MSCSVVVATHGEESWRQLALDRAIPSAIANEPLEVVPVHLAHGTLAQARHAGALKAKGQWLCFLDADDELAPGYLTAMRNAMVGLLAAFWSGWVLLVPAVEYVHPDGREDPPRVLNDGRPLYEINRAVIGTLVPRDLFIEAGGFRELTTLEDWALWLECERRGAVLADVADAVYRVHLRRGSRNADQSLYRKIRAEYERAA